MFEKKSGSPPPTPTTTPLALLNDEAAALEEQRAAESRPYRPTVEIPCLLLYFCTAVTGTAMANVLINRTCIHTLGHTEEFCELLQLPGEKPPDVQAAESEVQRFTTVISTVKSILDGLVPAMLALFLGSWSNQHGRKPLVVWPLFGFALSTGLLMAYNYAGTLGPWWYVVTSLPYSFAGGTSAFTTGAFCLLNDVSTEKNRTLRLALMQSSIFGGLILGLLSSSFLYGVIGPNNLLIIGVCLAVCAFIYSVLLIKESVLRTKGGGLGTVFDISLVKDMFRTCFKRRAGYGRLVLVLLVGANFIDLFVNHGITHIEYLYVRQKLSWNLPEQNLFSAVNTFIMIFGLFFGVGLLQRVFKLSDSLTTMISYISSTLEGIIRALANAAWVMYFGSAISIFRGLSFPLVRSMISKRVPRNDVATIFAFMSAIDATLPLVAPLFYNTVYRETLDTLPGAAFFVTAGLYFICFVIMWAARCVMARHPLQKDPVSEDVATKL